MLGGHGGTPFGRHLLRFCCCCWVCLASLRCLGGVENDEGFLALYSSDSEL